MGAIITWALITQTLSAWVLITRTLLLPFPQTQVPYFYKVNKYVLMTRALQLGGGGGEGCITYCEGGEGEVAQTEKI